MFKSSYYIPYIWVDVVEKMPEHFRLFHCPSSGVVLDCLLPWVAVCFYIYLEGIFLTEYSQPQIIMKTHSK